MKRLFWFAVGALCGVFGYQRTKRTVTEFSERLTPTNVASNVMEQALKVVGRLGKALRAATDVLLGDDTP
ncbi:MAG: hypothetical protein EXQ63_02920 [Ilumatobacteraceae bacterium]|nr:hypothetical protein [Ilumatobacteraceae bacterium]